MVIEPLDQFRIEYGIYMVYGFLIQTLVIHINMVWNHVHEIIHELIGYALALLWMTRLDSD